MGLDIPLAEIIQIKHLHRKLLSNKPPVQNKIIPVQNLKISQDDEQTVRKFGFPKSNKQEYTVGSLVPHEIGRGSNLLEPAREFKEFSLGKKKTSRTTQIYSYNIRFHKH